MKHYLEDPEARLSEVVKANLDRIITKRLNNQYDYVLVIVGNVGDGKSMLGALACSYVDMKLGNKFTTDRIFFTPMDYKLMERRLKQKMSLLFDEGEECFFSRRAMERHQKELILKFAQIRQRNHFIVICTPSLAMLEPWLRGIGVETRVNCIWRILRRGMFLSYADKTGKLQRIRIDKEKNTIIYPEADFVGFWKPIPLKSKFWQDYLKKKNAFLTMTKESAKVTRLREKAQKQQSESLTIKDIMEIQNVSESTVRKWIYVHKVFPKNSVFVDLSGKIRIKLKGYQIGIKKLERLKQRRRALLELKRYGKNGKKESKQSLV